MTKIGLRARRLTLCALFAALMCVLSPIALPLGAVPLSLGLLGVLITASTLSPAYAALSVAVFLALGTVGIPVFSGGMSGAAMLISPLGGYLWSYLLLAPAVSALSRRRGLWGSFLSALLGVLICYLCGTLQYCLVTQAAPLAALPVTVLPFLPLDIGKAFLAAALGNRLRRVLSARQG